MIKLAMEDGKNRRKFVLMLLPTDVAALLSGKSVELNPEDYTFQADFDIVLGLCHDGPMFMADLRDSGKINDSTIVRRSNEEFR